MRPDRGLAGPNGLEVLVPAGSYGLTPADGPAQLAGPAGSQAAGVTWPVRSGLVPPLADGFITRPETVPGLEAALVPGDAVALVPGQASAGRPDGPGSSVTNLSNFLDVLLVIFIPWSAVNLADYFLVRRGRYDVASFFTADGAYGRFAWRGLLAYAIGLGAEWPSVSSRTTPGRWSRPWAARTSPGWSAGSPPPSSTCSWSPWRPVPPAMTGPSPRPPG